MPVPLTDLSARHALPWARVLLNYTDEVVAAIPVADEDLDWRPGDNHDGWYFSIREQAMHIADTRHSLLGSLSGADTAEREFCTDYGGPGRPWQFRSAGRDEILSSLRAGREAVDAWLNKPIAELLETSPGLIAEHQRMLSKLREAGQDTTEREASGPGRILNTLFLLIAHEQSHRSVLQTMLRQRGHPVARYA